MARLPRFSVAGYPHHVIQRGNNRQPVFLDAQDHQRHLDLLYEHAAVEKVAVHAYVQMTNHVHLLMTPQTAEGLSRLMRVLAQRYTQYFNNRYQRTGTLWEGRYKSTVVESDRYLIACMVYLDLNPVRAAMVTRPADYRWSSHGHYIGQHPDKRLTPHPLYWGLGNTPFAREAAYVDLVEQGLSPAVQKQMTESVIKGWALGSEPFTRSLQNLTPRRVGRRSAGRPKK
jgi:putative transposase